MAYTKQIPQNPTGVYQTSPSYVLSFIRWFNRDTINYDDTEPQVSHPLVVVNDAVSIQVSESKSRLTGVLNIILKAGDINYATTLSPGDYVLVNLVNSEEKAIDIAQRAEGLRPINNYGDGFKGVYKIQKVRRQVIVDPNSGIKRYQFVVHAFSYTELNTTIYYNPTAVASFKKSKLLFIAQFADFWSEVSGSNKNLSNVQKVLVELTKALLGVGLNKYADLTISATQNAQFIAPRFLGRLLGVEGSNLSIVDIYHFIYGVWKGVFSQTTHLTPGQGFNPNIENVKGNKTFFQTKGGASSRLKGYRLLSAEDFNQKQLWSILLSYSNGAINESYTSTRVGLDNKVYPTLIFRQKPFNSKHFESPNKINNVSSKKKIDYYHTKFFELPRWKIDPSLIYNIDLGKDEVSRVNFLQLYGRSIAINDNINQALQAENIFFDQEDIQRHGMHPAIITSGFDFPVEDDLKKQSKDWAYLLFDMLNAGQLRESGTISCVGIEEPIAVGDNLNFDNSIYHIETVTHNMIIDHTTGKKQFRTHLVLSFGTSLDSDKTTAVYPQMQFSDTLKERIRDRRHEEILPGYSDTEDIPYSE